MSFIPKILTKAKGNRLPLIIGIIAIVISGVWVLNNVDIGFITFTQGGSGTPISDYAPIWGWEFPASGVTIQPSKLGVLLSSGQVEYNFILACDFSIWNRYTTNQTEEGVVNDLKSYTIDYLATITTGSITPSSGRLAYASSMLGDFTDTGGTLDIPIDIPVKWITSQAGVEATITVTIDYIMQDSTHYIVDSQTKTFILHGYSVPSAPRDLGILTWNSYGDDTIDLKWVKSDWDGGSPIIGYRVYRKSAGQSDDAYSLRATVTSTTLVNYDNVFIYIDPINAGYDYAYRVVSVNGNGEGGYVEMGVPTTLYEAEGVEASVQPSRTPGNGIPFSPLWVIVLGVITLKLIKKRDE